MISANEKKKKMNSHVGKLLYLELKCSMLSYCSHLFQSANSMLLSFILFGCSCWLLRFVNFRVLLHWLGTECSIIERNTYQQYSGVITAIFQHFVWWCWWKDCYSTALIEWMGMMGPTFILFLCFMWYFVGWFSQSNQTYISNSITYLSFQLRPLYSYVCIGHLCFVPLLLLHWCITNDSS